MRSLGLALVKFLVSGLLFSLFRINYMHDLYLRESFYPQLASSLSHYLEPLRLILFVCKSFRLFMFVWFRFFALLCLTFCFCFRLLSQMDAGLSPQGTNEKSGSLFKPNIIFSFKIPFVQTADLVRRGTVPITP